MVKSFWNWFNSLIPEQIQKSMAITLILSTAIFSGLGGYFIGGGDHISLTPKGDLIIGRRPLAEILEELDRQELEDFAAYYGPLADKGFYRAKIIMSFIDRKMEEQRLDSSPTNLVSNDAIREQEKEWIDAHDSDFVEDQLNKFRHYHLLDEKLVKAIKDNLKYDDTVARGLRELAHRGEGPFKAEKVMISVSNQRSEATALACHNSELLNKIVYLTSKENQSVNQGKPAYVPVDVVEMFDCSQKEEFDPCDQEDQPLALTKISSKNWLQISKKDADKLFPLSTRNNSFDKCELVTVKVSKLPGMP